MRKKKNKIKQNKKSHTNGKKNHKWKEKII